MDSGTQKKSKGRMSATDRRESILVAALEVFSEQGYHMSTVEELARAAGVSKALIYEHFRSKEDLHRTVIETQYKDLIERLTASASLEKPPELRLCNGLDAFFLFVEEIRDGWRVLYRDSTDPELAGVLHGAREQVTAAVTALIYADPQPSDMDPEERRRAEEILAHLITGAAESLANWWLDHQDVPRSLLVERVMGSFWIGLERLAAGERWTS